MSDTPYKLSDTSVTESYNRNHENAAGSLFNNNVIQTFSWSNISVTAIDRRTKEQRKLLDSVNGIARAGEVLALMGPSGSGKTTLLNVLANRSQIPSTGQTLVNGGPINKEQLRSISGYVEQDDALIGSLTVRETIEFSSKLAVPSLSPNLRQEMIDALLNAVGLSQQRDTIIGTPLRKGISGGQKRRTSVAAQLVASPKVVFLDEPTSGLDSTASYEVMKFISGVAKKHNLIIIASIHQPSTTTFELFDRLLLLSKGRTCYFGPVVKLSKYLDQLAPLPLRVNPAEFLLDLVNTDFRSTMEKHSMPDLEFVISHWSASEEQKLLQEELEKTDVRSNIQGSKIGSSYGTPLILLHRSWIKSYRDFLAYGTRIAMYLGLAIMMGTVWLRLPYTQNSIQPFVNALFFSGAFMSFMAVAYVPSIIEDLQTLHKEHANGLYGPSSFVLANFLIGIPWLLVITLLFSVVTYFLSNFRDDADGFWLWVMWLFLDLLAAEGLVVLLSSIFPIFVIALAATAFANGLWMAVGGFLVPMHTLNVFWKYVFHYIDYQAYVFQAMMYNQFKKTIYECEDTGSGYYCMFLSDLQSEGKIRGTAVLDNYGYSTETSKLWEWFGIMIVIIVIYGLLGYVALAIRLRSW